MSNPFIRHNAVFFAGSTIVSVLNYLYYPILSRLLHPADFGEVQALVSLFMQATIFLNVLSLVTVNIVSNEEDPEKRNALVFELEKLALYITLAGLILTILLAVPVQHFLNLDSPIPIIVTYLSVLVGVPLTFRSSFLRGRADFLAVSISNLLASLAKIFFSVALVGLGLRTVGAVSGLVAAQAVALVYTGLRAKSLGMGSIVKVHPKLPDLRLIYPELRYALLVLAVSLSQTIVFSIDIIAVKHFFPPDLAGQYAGISTIARIIFYIAGPIAIVMFSFIKLTNTSAQNLRLLAGTLGITVALGGAALLVFAAEPVFITKTLVGAQYTKEAHLLPLLSLAMLLLSLVAVIHSYYLALRHYGIGIVAIIGLIATLLLLSFMHSTLTNIVEALLFSSILMLLLIPLWLVAARIYPRARP